MNTAPDESNNSLVFRDARIVLPNRVAEHASLLLENGRIARVTASPGPELSGAASKRDLHGLTLFPGFIDVHIHGAVGVDTMEANGDSLDRVSQFLSSRGVTAWLPTLVPAPTEHYQRAIEGVGALMREQRKQEERSHWDRGHPARPLQGEKVGLNSPSKLVDSETERAGRPRSQYEELPLGARVLGAHYEGPFVNSQQCGALHREHFRTYSGSSDLDALPTPADDNTVRMMTVAPEIEGGVELVRELNRRGWIVSVGHTRAAIELLDRSFEAGARHMTHFMNAMTPLHHRSPGPVGWGLLRDDVTCDFIADGIHIDPDVVRLLAKLKTRDRLILISDAIAATGMGDGAYQIWGETIEVKNGRTQNSRGSIAGSVITMLDAVRMMMSLGVSEPDVARMSATNPASLLRIDPDCGSIEEGKRADLVALDAEGEVRLTIIGGRVVFAAGGPV